MTFARRLVVGVLLACLPCTGGCGTVANLVLPINSEKKYGGIPADLHLLLSTDGLFALVAMIFVPFVDMPLSFLGDTITYPLARWIDDQHAKHPPEERYPQPPFKPESIDTTQVIPEPASSEPQLTSDPTAAPQQSAAPLRKHDVSTLFTPFSVADTPSQVKDDRLSFWDALGFQRP